MPDKIDIKFGPSIPSVPYTNTIFFHLVGNKVNGYIYDERGNRRPMINADAADDIAQQAVDDSEPAEFQKTATHIQWRAPAGSGSWTDLVSLAEITGPAGSGGGTDEDTVILYALSF